MHKKLLLMAFDKVRGELNDEGDKSPSINKCAIRLSDIVSHDFAYSPKSFNTLHKRAVENEENNFIIPKPEVIPILVKYLGYKNYEEFILLNKEKVQKEIDDGSVLLISPTDSQEQQVEKNSIKTFINTIKSKKSLAFGALLLGAVTIATYLYIDRQKWMVWNGHRFEVTSFDPEMEKNGVLS